MKVLPTNIGILSYFEILSSIQFKLIALSSYFLTRHRKSYKLSDSKNDYLLKKHEKFPIYILNLKDNIIYKIRSRYSGCSCKLNVRGHSMWSFKLTLCSVFMILVFNHAHWNSLEVEQLFENLNLILMSILMIFVYPGYFLLFFYFPHSKIYSCIVVVFTKT